MQTFIAKKQADCLDRVVSSVYVVSQKHITFLSHRWDNVGKQIAKIIVLSMDVSDHKLLSRYLDNIGLLKQNAGGSPAQVSDFRLAEQL